MESSEADQRGIEDYDKDVSSRGRLRKRRLIPNNIEDQGLKKKKVAKKAEDVVAVTVANHIPSTLPGSLIGDSLSAARLKACVQMGANEEVKAEQSGQQSDTSQPLSAGPGVFKGPQLIQKHPGLPGLAASAVPNPGAVRPSSHPVMQKMLRQLPLAGRQALQGAKTNPADSSLPNPAGLSNAAVAVTVVPTVPTATVSRATAVHATGTRSLLLNAIGPDGQQQQIRLNTQQQQELLRQGILIYQVSLCKT